MFKTTDLKTTICNILLGTGIGATGLMEFLNYIGLMYSKLLPFLIGTMTIILGCMKGYDWIKKTFYGKGK